MLFKSLGNGLIGLFVLAFSAKAGTSGLEGFVRDASGRPIKGADVRIEAKNFSKIFKTDDAGCYIAEGLAVGFYKVTLVVNGSIKATILNAKTQSSKPTKLNFDLPVEKHMIWIAGETGTWIGTGRWLTVDGNGNLVDD